MSFPALASMELWYENSATPSRSTMCCWEARPSPIRIVSRDEPAYRDWMRAHCKQKQWDEVKSHVAQSSQQIAGTIVSSEVRPGTAHLPRHGRSGACAGRDHTPPPAPRRTASAAPPPAAQRPTPR